MALARRNVPLGRIFPPDSAVQLPNSGEIENKIVGKGLWEKRKRFIHHGYFHFHQCALLFPIASHKPREPETLSGSPQNNTVTDSLSTVSASLKTKQSRESAVSLAFLCFSGKLDTIQSKAISLNSLCFSVNQRHY
ncbi:hypothetical protein Ddc_14244 [Ditylenchus destructor]|nr:hypothetical protein Ddc_14244 [Ditylenchus destructor]